MLHSQDGSANLGLHQPTPSDAAVSPKMNVKEKKAYLVERAGKDEAQMASAHLWDGDSGEYNIPFVRRFLPGTPILIHEKSKR